MPVNPLSEVDNGWTTVGKGKGKGRGGTAAIVDGFNPPIRDYTVEQVTRDFDRKLMAWQRSSCRLELLQILDRQQPDEGWNIENAICFATGSYSRDNFQSRQRSVMQAVAFLDIVQHLETRQDTEIAKFAQEPHFTEIDASYLSSKGVQTLPCEPNKDDRIGLGKASQHLSASTFVFEPFMDLDAAAASELFSVDVPLYIGSSLKRWTTQPSIMLGGAHRESAMQQAIVYMQARRSYYFPTFEEDPNAFEGLSIYWREPGELNS